VIRRTRIAIVAVALTAGLDLPAAAQVLLPTLVRLDSLGVLQQLARAGYEVAGIERVDGVPHAVIVATPAQQPALAAAGLAARAGPEVPAAAPAHLRDLARVHAALDSLAAAGAVALDTVGTSWEGRPVVAAKVGTAPDAPERPNVLFMGAHHAREWISAEVALRLLETLAGDPPDPDLVARRDVWVIPVVNPDGFQFSFDSTRLWRKNRRINGDGTIGVDLNRNYPGFWGWDDLGSNAEPAAETYRGPAAGSEPETQAVLAFHERHPPAAAISYHSYSDLILYPYGYASGALAPDTRRFAATAGTPGRSAIQDALLESARPAYHPGPAWQLYPTNGEYTEWAYRTYGTLAFTVELTAGCCFGGSGYGFVFPDDSAAIATVFADNLPFVSAVLEAAAAPANAAAASWETLWPEARLVAPPGAPPIVTVAGPVAGTLQLTSDSADRGSIAWRWRAALGGDVAGARLATGGGLETRIVYADGAERDSTWTGWIRDTTGSKEGAFHWIGAADTLRSPDIAIHGVTAPRLAFWVSHQGSLFLPERYATVDLSTDGGASWTNLLRLEGAAPVWYPVSVDLPAVPTVRIRIAAHEMPLRVDAVHVFGTATAAFAIAAGELGLSENPVRSGRVFLTWDPGSGDARVSVFTFTGLLVYRATVPGAAGQAVWDLTDLDGRAVANGAYAVTLEVGDQVLRRRLFVARGP
jgi:hypothetical protein